MLSAEELDLTSFHLYSMIAPGSIPGNAKVFVRNFNPLTFTTVFSMTASLSSSTIEPSGLIVELLKDDVIEKTVVKVSGLKLRTKTFAFPGIEPGAIIEYKWKERSEEHTSELQS